MPTGELPAGLDAEIEEHIGGLEGKAGKRFGDPDDPLLVSVRSGAAVSMPGMMDTILNLGLNDDAVEGLAKTTGNARFARDSYRRLIQMYGEVVDGVDGHRFEQALADLKSSRGVKQDVELTDGDLAELIETYKRIYAEATGEDFPQDAHAQLERAVRAVFDSWNSPRAQVYRRTYEIPDDLGTAVNVVQMVFGNKGDTSGTGVCFTRDPSTGESRLYGEFLQNAQGEDVVAGIRTPEPIERMGELLPEAYAQLLERCGGSRSTTATCRTSNSRSRTSTLYLLQTRSAKRTAAAALKSAVEMADEGLISKEEAVARIDPAQLDQLLHPRIDPGAEVDVVAKGLNASPGAASGAIVFDADTAEERGKAGESVILVRWETTPDDFHGMVQAAGILTAHGGLTSHAAVVARGMGTPCVTGCEALHVDVPGRTARLPGHELQRGRHDHDRRRHRRGDRRLRAARPAAAERRLRLDPRVGRRDQAAEGAHERGHARGCRQGTRVRGRGHRPLPHRAHVRRGRAARARARDDPGDRRGRPPLRARPPAARPAGRLRGDLRGDGGLPRDDPAARLAAARVPALARGGDRTSACASGSARSRRRTRCSAGARAASGSSSPRSTRCRCGRSRAPRSPSASEPARRPLVEIMHPLVALGEELRRLRELTVRTAAEEGEFEYLVGTMIELPRACVRADEIAEHADFFSFGTNDLTQTALGLSRDDAGRFLSLYLEQGILERDPFETIDQEGVGELMRIAVERGRGVRDDLKLGICGEHGGEPKSVAFCHDLGLDYVSCSPYRVPLARLAAAQAALAEQGVTAVAIGG